MVNNLPQIFFCTEKRLYIILNRGADTSTSIENKHYIVSFQYKEDLRQIIHAEKGIKYRRPRTFGYDCI